MASSPPPCTPFDFNFLFTDDFHAPNQGLYGYNGWVDIEHGTHEPQIVSNTCRPPVVTDDATADHLITFGTNTIEGGTYVEFSVIPVAITAFDEQINLYWGDENAGFFFGITIDFASTFGVGVNATLTINDNGGTFATSTPFNIDPATAHTCRLYAVAGTLIGTVDGIVRITIPAADLTRPPDQILLFFAGNAGGQIPQVTQVSVVAPWP